MSYEIKTLLTMLCIVFGMNSCTHESVRQEYEELKSDIRGLKSENRKLFRSLPSEFRGLGPDKIEQKLRRNLREHENLLLSLESRIRTGKKNITQIRSVSAVYNKLGKALNKFNTQYNDIVDQQELFNRKNSDFGYIGTRHARRITLKELRDINVHLIQQCCLQKDWYQELQSYSQAQIHSVSWNNDSYRQMAETKYQKMIEPMRVKIPNIEKYLHYQETFDFSKLEHLTEGR